MARRLVLAFVLIFFSTSSLADWVLNPESKLSFVSVKADTIGETHHFSKMSGSVSSEGHVELRIDLSSVETQIPIRNARMLEFLFEVTAFPQATVSATIDTKTYRSMAVGEHASVALPVALELHGKRVSLNATLVVVKLDNTQLLVASASPLLIRAADFDMVPGIDKLQSLAGLPSITKVVPVSFHLIFDM